MISEQTRNKLTTIAENEQKVYDNGVADGKRAEYDAFWDVYQNYGQRTSYRNAFYGEGWTASFFKPKYPIAPEGDTSCMFWLFNKSNPNNRLDLSRFNIDFGKATSLERAFSDAMISDCGFVDCSNATTISRMCDGGWHGRSIQKILLKVNANHIFSGTFDYAYNLTDLMFTEDSEIGNSISVAWSPLTPTSLKNILKHMKDYYGTTDEFKYTLTVKASAWEALEAEGFTDEDYRWIVDVWGGNPTVIESWEMFVGGWLGWNLVLA